jgi:hypothetical protein
MTTTTFHAFKISKTAAEFDAQIAKERDQGCGLIVAIPVNEIKLYQDTYQSGHGVSIETTDGAVWLGEINDTSDYYVDDEHGFIQHPTEVYVELM